MFNSNFRLTHEQTDSLFVEPLRLVGPHLSAVLKHSFRGRDGKNTSVFAE